MQTDHTLNIEFAPDPVDRQVIEHGLQAFNRQHAGDEDHQSLSIFIRDAEQQVIAGLLGDTFYGWLAINLLWVAEAWRGHGYGRQLLRAAEAEALRRGCRHALVDTLDFQAPDFYRREGYIIFGELNGLPPGCTRYYLRKKLGRETGDNK